MTPEMTDPAILISNSFPDDFVLSSVYEIENAILALEKLDAKLGFMQGVKKFRTQSVDEQIKDLKIRSERIRGVILRTMQSLSDQKTLHFPSVAKVTRKKSSQTWSITDEDSVLLALDKIGLRKNVVETKEVVNARKLSALLSELDERGVNIPGAVKAPGNETIAVTYENKELPAGQSRKSLEFDDLEV